MEYKPIHNRFEVELMFSGRWKPFQYDANCIYEYATFRTYANICRPIREALRQSVGDTRNKHW